MFKGAFNTPFVTGVRIPLCYKQLNVQSNYQ
jgi:hypothetical protein